MTKKLLTYICILVGVTLGLYGLTSFLSTMDWKYFKTHESQLTTTSNVGTPDDYATYYYYGHTPYYYSSLIVRYISWITPIVLVFLFSAKFLLKYIDKKPFVRSLYFPAIYGAVTVIYFLLAMDPATGWEYSVGLLLVSIEIIIIFILTMIINAIVLSRKFKTKTYEMVQKNNWMKS